jgi:hypothetical protein
MCVTVSYSPFNPLRPLLQEAAAVSEAADSMARFVETLVDPCGVRDAFCAAFCGTDPALATGAVRLSAALLEHRSVNPDVLDAAGTALDVLRHHVAATTGILFTGTRG